MATHYVDEKGNPIGEGKRIQPTAVKTVLRIEINSIGMVSPSVLKSLLQAKYDVHSVDIETEIVTCKVR